MKENEDSIPEKITKESKAKMTHLYKIIGKMTPNQYCKYDFLMNFGVSISSKVSLQKAVENALNYAEFKAYLSKRNNFNKIDKIPFKEVLIIHKYFTFADKKIKVIMYNEQIDQVSEDLLKEVSEKPVAPVQKEVQAKKKRDPGKVVKANKKVDRLKNGML